MSRRGSAGVLPTPPPGQKARNGLTPGEFAATYRQRTYSQALTLAKAQAAVGTATRSKTGNPLSPKTREEDPSKAKEEKWFIPGITQLKEVCPRKALTRRRRLDEKRGKVKPLFCSQFQSGAARHVDNAVERGVSYSLSFSSGTALDGVSGTVHIPDDSGSSIKADEAATARANKAAVIEEDDDEGVVDVGVWKLIRQNKGRVMDMCDPHSHTRFLGEQVYRGRCFEIDAKPNSGVLALLQRSVTIKESGCFCRLQLVTFRNFALGDRGLQALLPLLTFTHSLKCLCLAGNGAREASIRQLCAILSDANVMELLVALDLSQNPLGAAASEELVQLVTQRPSLLLLGAVGTQLLPARRQFLLQRCLSNFKAAEDKDKFAALDLTSEAARKSGAFVDLELVRRCELLVPKDAVRPIPPPDEDGGANETEKQPRRRSHPDVLEGAALSPKSGSPRGDRRSSS